MIFENKKELDAFEFICKFAKDMAINDLDKEILRLKINWLKEQIKG